MNKKHYLVYKTTCLVNGKIYIGQHQTYDPDDEYLGSGRDLKEDIRKFGSENFKREILFDFDNFTDMDNKEKELVTEEFVNREDTYNVRLGGQNVDWHELEKLGMIKHTREHAIHAVKFFVERLKTDLAFREKYCRHQSEIMRRFCSEHPEITNRFRHIWCGKSHSEETKRKISIANSLNHFGENNANYGNRWVSDIFNEICYTQNKSIPLEDYQLATRIQDFEKYKLEQAEVKMEQVNKIEHQKRLKELRQTFFSAFYDEYLKTGFKNMCQKFGIQIERTTFLHLCKKRVPYYNRYNRWRTK